MDFPICIDTIGMEFSVLYFNGLQAKISIKRLELSILYFKGLQVKITIK